MDKELSPLEQLKQLDMVVFLSRLGFKPEKITGNNYWYKSPLREEHTPSFKVTKGKTGIDIFWDFGTGIHGNLVDFCLRYYGITIGALVEKLQQNAGSFFFGQPFSRKDTAGQKEKKGNGSCQLIQASAIRHPALVRYMATREIPLSLGKKYLNEIHFSVRGRNYFALGFKNNDGGYELRNEKFKGCIPPKASTLFETKGKNLLVFEGFFDFLSFRFLQEGHPDILKGLPKEPDILVLNALSFAPKLLEITGNYSAVHLLLDRDEAGKKATEKLRNLSSQFSDKSELFAPCKDLNEWLTGHKKVQRERLNPPQNNTYRRGR